MIRVKQYLNITTLGISLSWEPFLCVVKAMCIVHARSSVLSSVLSYSQAHRRRTEPVQILRCHTRRAGRPSGSAEQSGTAVYHLSPPATWNTGSSLYLLDFLISWSFWRRCFCSPHCSFCCMVHKYEVYIGCAAGSANQSRTAVHRLTPPFHLVHSQQLSGQLTVDQPGSSSFQHFDPLVACAVHTVSRFLDRIAEQSPSLGQLFTTSLLLPPCTQVSSSRFYL